MNEIIGIVACGGKSTRMKSDKSKLIYHQLEQRFHVYKMLSEICSDVFISCNSEQSSTIANEYNFIVDDVDYTNCGPIAALLSYWKMGSKKDVLMVGCDYPLINLSDLEKLKSHFYLTQKTICYYNELSNYYEPLISIYSYSDYANILSNHRKGNNSLQYFLNEISAYRLIPDDPNRVKSIDEKSEYNKLIKIIKEFKNE